MADEVVYRLIAGAGAQLLEDSATRTIEISVPSLDQKLNVGDIGQASQVSAGIIEIANSDEMVAGTDPARAVTPAGLTSISQSSATDATAGRLLKVGALGLGGNIIEITSGSMLADKPTGFYQFTGNTTDKPFTSAGFSGVWLRRDNGLGSIEISVTAISNSNPPREFRNRYLTSAWTGWVEIFHTGNFDPATKANTSGSYLGLNVGNAATVGNQLATDLAPPGMRGEFFTGFAPAGWLKANGAAVSRTTYARLFASIGTTFGAGNGSTTFNLPDARGLFSRGWDDARGVDPGRVLFSVQGSQNLSHAHVVHGVADHAHTINGVADHAHTINGVGDHTHTAPSSQGVGQGTAGPNTVQQSGGTHTTAPAGAHTHTMNAAGAHTHTMNAAGSHTHGMNADGGGESRPINQAVLVCIKY